jgi:hypothetical protein
MMSSSRATLYADVVTVLRRNPGDLFPELLANYLAPPTVLLQPPHMAALGYHTLFCIQNSL